MASSVRRYRPPASERGRIREAFLRPHPSYTIADAARLLALPEDEVRRRIEDGSIEADGLVVPWRELIGVAAAERWTPRLLAEALPRTMVPRLARSVSGTIVLPAYQWKVLGALPAAEDREYTVSDWIERAIHQVYVEEIRDWHSLERRMPGIRAAAAWPLGDE